MQEGQAKPVPGSPVDWDALFIAESWECIDQMIREKRAALKAISARHEPEADTPHSDWEIPVGTFMSMSGEIFIPGVPNPTEEQLDAVRRSVAQSVAADSPFMPMNHTSVEYKPEADTPHVIDQ